MIGGDLLWPFEGDIRDAVLLVSQQSLLRPLWKSDCWTICAMVLMEMFWKFEEFLKQLPTSMVVLTSGHQTSVGAAGLFHSEDNFKGTTQTSSSAGSQGLWSLPSMWFLSHARCWTRSWIIWKCRVVETFFKHMVPTHRNGAALMEGMMGRGLQVEFRQQATCAHPLSQFPSKPLRLFFRE